MKYYQSQCFNSQCNADLTDIIKNEISVRSIIVLTEHQLNRIQFKCTNCNNKYMAILARNNGEDNISMKLIAEIIKDDGLVNS